jgi:hypothetical protein
MKLKNRRIANLIDIQYKSKFGIKRFVFLVVVNMMITGSLHDC